MPTPFSRLRAAISALFAAGLLATSAAAPTRAAPLDAASVVDTWLTLWNGNLDLSRTLIADRFTLHATMLDGSDSAAIHSPDAFEAWVAKSRVIFPDLHFTSLVGPMVSSAGDAGTFIAVHWRAEATYAGGMPNAAAPLGKRISFTGTDVIRVTDGRVAEYWLVTDTMAMFSALGVD